MSQSLKLLQQLEKAIGQTQHVLAVVFDIRGFTDFCRGEDSYNIANFVRRVYVRVLSDYFQDATFYKPTGDGLLMVFNCCSGKEVELTKSVVERSVKLIKDFAGLCKGDLLIYFKTPRNCGIGISRGSACCIFSDGEILDYSGKPLNLASRLSDIARPFGVVFDESVSSCIPSVDLDKDFLSENVYIKGLAEDKSIKVYLTKETVIPSSYKKPINETEWMIDSRIFSIRKMENWTGAQYAIRLSKIPLNVSQIIVRTSFPQKGSTGIYVWNIDDTPNVKYVMEGNQHKVLCNKAYLIRRLLKQGAQPTTPVKIEVEYPVKT